MSIWLKATGIGGSLLVIFALIITFLKQIIAFVGFLTVAIKLLVILVFVALLVAIGFMILKSWNAKRKITE
ncbi:MAG: hypothetical protein M3Q33_03740 [Acidobacteriota bacterium]|nr:hypothetical protein [Acidobacteriota bacterium]